uniref:Uncharacterized protein n=1 Tax=Ficus carica TaxID=3494 RepID=A0AA88E8D0_FICCA|nr:hypothetical protein TIFTF001_036681 [Ficus carica]
MENSVGGYCFCFELGGD